MSLVERDERSRIHTTSTFDASGGTISARLRLIDGSTSLFKTDVSHVSLKLGSTIHNRMSQMSIP